MKKHLIFLTFFAVLIQPIAAPAYVAVPVGGYEAILPGDVFPPEQTPRRREIDIRHIALELKFNWEKKRAIGTATISFAPLESLDRIALDAGFLTIHKISTPDGRPLEFDYDGGDRDGNLRVRLGRVFKKDESTSVRIEYHTNQVNETDPNSPGGSNGKGLRFSRPTSNDPLKPREVWSFGDPQANRYWFPSFDAPNDPRTTEFTATVPKELTVVSNGTLLSNRENADGTRTFHFKAEQPHANHRTSFVMSEYINVRKTSAGVVLNNFGYPQEREWIAASVERLPEMIRFFEDKTGVKYPFRTYSQAFVQDIGTFSGNHSVSTITENMVDDFGTHADYFYLWDLTEAEALAAQWFGGHVAVADWRDAWLERSLAHMFSGLFNEFRNGRDEFLLYQHGFDHGVHLNDWNSGKRRPLATRFYDDAATMTGDNYASIRGALVLQTLRREIGEDSWWKSIRRFLVKNGGKTVTTEDFRSAVNAATGKSYDWFFDQWIFKMGHPVFEVSRRYDGDSKMLEVRVRQVQKSDPKSAFPQAGFFRGNLELEIDGRIERILIEPVAENIFKIALPAAPSFVNFDFQSSWIKEVSYEQTTDELLAVFERSRDILARNNAIVELVARAGTENLTAGDREKISTAIRRVITSDAYWRLRFNTIGLIWRFFGGNPLDPATKDALLGVIKKDSSWTRASAITALGRTGDPQFAELYLGFLNDPSDRVIASAATALGRTKSPKAFDALVRLKDRPSMKSQSLLSALGGLKALGDPRGFDVALAALRDLKRPRWRLPSPPPSWDFRPVAADLIVALGRGSEILPMLSERIDIALAENDIDGVFNNLMMLAMIKDPRTAAVFEKLKTHYKDDKNALAAIANYEKAN